MRGGELYTGAIDLSSSASLSGQVNHEVVSDAWGNRGVRQPDLTVKCQVKVGVQTHSRKVNPVTNLLGCAKMENLQNMGENPLDFRYCT